MEEKTSEFNFEKCDDVWDDIPKHLLVKSIKKSSDNVKQELATELYSIL